ncbi:MAG: ATP-dependent DNA ligase [Myxococcota bacterium]
MLPVRPPLAPMLGKLADTLPEAEGFWYEPKWDGFRVIAFRDGDDLDLRSRDNRPLLRYFPELAPACIEALPERCVVDGEVVIVSDGALDFDALQMRLHPAKSRIDKLAAETPSALVLWDLLALGDDDLRDRPLSERRALLEAHVKPGERLRITPGTTDRTIAEDWFSRFEGAGFDGVMAKALDQAYLPGQRGLLKVKHVRTIDCVVVGFRWHKHGHGTEVGSLVLALYDGDGKLWPIGVCSSFRKAQRVQLAEELAPLQTTDPDHPWVRHEGEAHRPDVRSRWAADRSLAFEALRLERVVEVKTTQHGSRRLRHPAKFLRWRTDKPPAECSLEQLQTAPAPELSTVFENP